MRNILTSSLTQLHKHIQNRTVSVSEICHVFLDRIAEVDERVRAFINVDSDAVLKRATENDAKLQKKDFQAGRFTGIPIALKDVIVTLNIDHFFLSMYRGLDLVALDHPHPAVREFLNQYHRH